MGVCERLYVCVLVGGFLTHIFFSDVCVDMGATLQRSDGSV